MVKTTDPLTPKDRWNHLFIFFLMVLILIVAHIAHEEIHQIQFIFNTGLPCNRLYEKFPTDFEGLLFVSS